MLWMIAAMAMGPRAMGQDVNIGILGQSNAKGYAPPLNGTTIAHGTYTLNGDQQTTYHNLRAGIEQSLAECLSLYGYTPHVFTRAANGILLSTVANVYTPNLISDGAMDAVILIHGENDATNGNPGVALDYDHRLVGPWYDGGQFGCTQDTSVLGQLRSAMPDVPMVVTELRTTGEEDWLAGDPGNGNYEHHQTVRAKQHNACVSTPNCYLLQTERFPTSDGLHYSSQGMWDLGWSSCELIVQRVLQPTCAVP